MTIRCDAEFQGMQRVGKLVAQTLAHMRALVRPGITTSELDEAGAAFARAQGARSAPQLTYNFPGFSCISLNEQIVHGVPGPRALAEGDVLKLDVTLELDGYMADSAVTVLLPPVSLEATQLELAARAALSRGLQAARPGRMVRAVGAAIEQTARQAGVAVLRGLSGHGIGRRLHEAPEVPNWSDPLARHRLHEGLVIAVEPMFSARTARVIKDTDGWTLKTHNRSLAVHHEHTIMIRRGEPLILTAA